MPRYAVGDIPEKCDIHISTDRAHPQGDRPIKARFEPDALLVIHLDHSDRGHAANLLPVVWDDHVDAKVLHFSFMLDSDMRAPNRPLLQIPFADVTHLAAPGELQIDADPKAHG